MSTLVIRSVLEKAVHSMTPALDTAWENVKYTPKNGVPYQDVWFQDFLSSTPELSPNHIIESYFQIDLFYPIQFGSKDALTRAELIKGIFKRGSSFVKNGITVTITKPPEISSGIRSGDRWKVSVKIFYRSFIVVN